jgi:hypothetical protein
MRYSADSALLADVVEGDGGTNVNEDGAIILCQQ